MLRLSMASTSHVLEGQGVRVKRESLSSNCIECKRKASSAVLWNIIISGSTKFMSSQRKIQKIQTVPVMISVSHSVMSDSLRPHGLQHTRLSSPSPTPRACSNLYPLSQGCHPTVSSSVIPFSSCLQSFPASGSFPMSQFFASGGQSIGTSASPSVLPMNIPD